ALLVAVVLHVMAFFALGKIKVALGFSEAEEIRTAPIQVDRVEIPAAAMEDLDSEPSVAEVPDSAELLDEVEVLEELPENMEMDLMPDIEDPEFAIQPQQPAEEGAPDVLDFEIGSSFDLTGDLPELGRTEAPLPMAAEGQVIVDPGAMDVADSTLDAFTEEILESGADGRVAEGALDGVVTLDDMVGLPENVLVGKKTMLPSDLLFDYNSAELRESARVGLMKLALLIERNPGLFCWIEGHTDLYGGDDFNLDLSKRRSESVKQYLTQSLMLPADRIVARGFGEFRPMVAEGSVEEQAPNRRVEVKMRRSLPPAEAPVLIRPKAPVLDALSSEVPAVEEGDEPEPGPVNPPKAVPVPESVPRAVPVPEEVPRAVPVPEEIPRAVPVPED
ncbi:MAG: OmpA family protein, partial [Verrucomicrobiales bacterium]